jgi:sulfoxide reductase heme-binding subunit YedZ
VDAPQPSPAERLLRSRAFVLAALALPALWPAWPIVSQDPTVLADPGKYILHHLGFVACMLLAVVLCFTPLRVVFPRSRLALALNRHRRVAGVSVFVYAALHFAMYLIYEGGFGTLANDIGKPFILAGVVALAGLAVLAVTSLDRAVRALGGRRWKNLHRLVYLIAALAAYHQIAASKLFPVQVLWIFGPMLALQALRLAKKRVRDNSRPPTTA